jgi:hypothetical protein
MPSETKWPKGPWTQRRYPDVNSILRIIFAGDVGMGEVYQADGITDEQADAIADLFCAAPDLYEALEAALIVCAPADLLTLEAPLTGVVSWMEWRTRARAALAKARGESNAKEEQLRSFIPAICQKGLMKCRCFECARERARAALAKARGESPGGQQGSDQGSQGAHQEPSDTGTLTLEEIARRFRDRRPR